MPAPRDLGYGPDIDPTFDPEDDRLSGSERDGSLQGRTRTASTPAYTVFEPC